LINSRFEIMHCDFQVNWITFNIMQTTFKIVLGTNISAMRNKFEVLCWFSHESQNSRARSNRKQCQHRVAVNFPSESSFSEWKCIGDREFVWFGGPGLSDSVQRSHRTNGLFMKISDLLWSSDRPSSLWDGAINCHRYSMETSPTSQQWARHSDHDLRVWESQKPGAGKNWWHSAGNIPSHNRPMRYLNETITTATSSSSDNDCENFNAVYLLICVLRQTTDSLSRYLIQIRTSDSCKCHDHCHSFQEYHYSNQMNNFKRRSNQTQS
jgi:hypothetical protein